MHGTECSVPKQWKHSSSHQRLRCWKCGMLCWWKAESMSTRLFLLLALKSSSLQSCCLGRITAGQHMYAKWKDWDKDSQSLESCCIPATWAELGTLTISRFLHSDYASKFHCSGHWSTGLITFRLHCTSAQVYITQHLQSKVNLLCNAIKSAN